MGCILKLLAAVAVMLKVGGVGFVSESCPMLGFCMTITKNSGFSQVMGVYSVFVGFIIRLCSPSNVCAWSVDTRVYTKFTLSSPRSAQLFYLHCTLV